MNRRLFVQGLPTVAAAVAAPFVVLRERYRYRSYSTAFSRQTKDELADDGRRMAEALARSMRQTRTHIAANIEAAAKGPLDPVLVEEIRSRTATLD